MIQGYVGAEIRRTNRNLLVTNLVIAALVLALPLIFFPYVKECLGGPYPMTVKEIAALNSKSDAPHRYIKVQLDDDALDENIYEITGGDAKKDDHYFFQHLADGKILIILMHTDTPPATVVGSLSDLSGDIDEKVIPAIQGKVSGTPVPVSVDASSYTDGFHAMIGLGTPVLLLCLWNILKAVGRRGDPLKSPIAKSLARVGPPEEMAIALDAEMAEGGKKVGRVVATRSWLVQSNTFNTDFVYLGDVAWAYKSETKHKTYGVTTSRTYATVIFDVHGKRHEYALSQDQVHTLLGELASRVPWAILGYNADLQKSWAKKRSEVIAQVAERKRKFLESGAGNEPPGDAGAAG